MKSTDDTGPDANIPTQGGAMNRAEAAGVPIVKAAGRARDLAARLVNASTRYTAQAKHLAEVAPETFEQVCAGRMTVPEAYRLVFPDKYATGNNMSSPEADDPRSD